MTMPTVTPPGEPTHQDKMVPEKDLLAVKAKVEGLEKQLAEKVTEIEGFKQSSDSNYQLMLNEKASKDVAETKLTELQAQDEKVVELQSQLDAATTRSEGSDSKILGLRKEILAGKYTNVSLESLDGKDLAGLDNLEEALKYVGEHKGSSIDSGGGGGAIPSMTSKEKMAAGLAELNIK